MTALRDWLRGERKRREQALELRMLRAEVLALRTQNEKMRAAMRRCLTCEYRLEVLGRR
ncbi:MAG: hypothetical protein QNK04_05380 [Myxococcota bacterium]|nr:hypothetical protein [Myxococcota bacterium]